MIRKEKKSRLAKLDINREEIDALNKNVEEVSEVEEEREHRTLNVQHRTSKGRGQSAGTKGSVQ